MKTLDQLAKNAKARVLEVHGETETVTRLHALGFLPGKVVRHRNTAPLGDPLAYEIEGQKISMRKIDARVVQIEEIAE